MSAQTPNLPDVIERYRRLESALIYDCLDSMGLPPAIGLGLALGLASSTFDKVITIEGDGGMLMGFSVLSTIGMLKPEKMILVIHFVPKDWPGLEWKGFDPIIVCGQQSLAVFCVGVFLSFVGHFELSMSSGSLFAQIFVSVAGIAIMTTVAYYISWSKKQDKPLKPPPPKPAAAKAA